MREKLLICTGCGSSQLNPDGRGTLAGAQLEDWKCAECGRTGRTRTHMRDDREVIKGDLAIVTVEGAEKLRDEIGYTFPNEQ